jgi:hypothetical protein
MAKIAIDIHLDANLIAKISTAINKCSLAINSSALLIAVATLEYNLGSFPASTLILALNKEASFLSELASCLNFHPELIAIMIPALDLQHPLNALNHFSIVIRRLMIQARHSHADVAGVANGDFHLQARYRAVSLNKTPSSIGKSKVKLENAHN